MGLDWNPGPRAKSGHQAEWDGLFRKIHGGWSWNKSGKIKRFQEISEDAFCTLDAPTVGVDPQADIWAKALYATLQEKPDTVEAFLSRLKGFRVLELVPPCDGLPRYTNGQPGGYVEAYSFRAQFLTDAETILGKELFQAAYESKDPGETVAYGERLLWIAREFAMDHRVDLAGISSPEDPESPEWKLDILVSAGKWCLFWGNRGHWLEAYF